MLSAAGTRGRPGMVMIAPQITTTNSAPPESRTSRNRHLEAAWRVLQRGIGREAVLRLRHADGEVTEPARLELVEPPADGRVRRDAVGAVYPLGDSLDLLPEREIVRVEGLEGRGLRLDGAHHLVRQRLAAGAAHGPVVALDRRDPHLGATLRHQRALGLGIGGKAVDRHHRRDAVALHVLHMAGQVLHAGRQRVEVLGAEVLPGDAAMHLERADGGHDHRAVRRESGLAALDVEELLGPKIGAEAGLGHSIVGELERGPGRDHRVAAVGDVGEGAAVDEGGVVLQRLDQIGC